MKVRCSSPASKTWLTNAVQYIPALWKGMKLEVIDFDKIPKPKKVLGLFPNYSTDCDDICSMLGAMNACVDTSRWTILTNKVSSRGTHIAFALSEDQFAVMKSCNFELYFGAGMAVFKDISANKDDENAQESMEEDTGEGTEIGTEDAIDLEDLNITSEDSNETVIASEKIETDRSDASNDAQQLPTENAPQEAPQPPESTGASSVESKIAGKSETQKDASTEPTASN